MFWWHTASACMLPLTTLSPHPRFSAYKGGSNNIKRRDLAAVIDLISSSTTPCSKPNQIMFTSVWTNFLHAHKFSCLAIWTAQLLSVTQAYTYTSTDAHTHIYTDFYTMPKLLSTQTHEYFHRKCGSIGSSVYIPIWTCHRYRMKTDRMLKVLLDKCSHNES